MQSFSFFSNKKGSAELTVLIVVIALGFLLAGGLFQIKQDVNVQTLPTTLNFQGATTADKTLQLKTLQFVTPEVPESTKTTCNYVEHGYPEPSILYNLAFSQGGGAGNGYGIKAFYVDETVLTLNAKRSGPSQTTDAHNSHPDPGDTSIKDTNNLPFAPSLFLTDITNNPNDTSGDAQNGGSAHYASDVYGTWQTHTNGNPTQINTTITKNGTIIIRGTRGIACNITKATLLHGFESIGGDPFPGPTNNIHSCGESEIVWRIGDLPVQSGHTYRGQVIIHDGDFTGDLGEGCVNFTAL